MTDPGLAFGAAFRLRLQRGPSRDGGGVARALLESAKVHLGTLELLLYEKKCIDDEARVRAAKKKGKK